MDPAGRSLIVATITRMGRTDQGLAFKKGQTGGGRRQGSVVTETARLQIIPLWMVQRWYFYQD